MFATYSYNAALAVAIATAGYFFFTTIAPMIAQIVR